MKSPTRLCSKPIRPSSCPNRRAIPIALQAALQHDCRPHPSRRGAEPQARVCAPSRDRPRSGFKYRPDHRHDDRNVCFPGRRLRADRPVPASSCHCGRRHGAATVRLARSGYCGPVTDGSIAGARSRMMLSFSSQQLLCAPRPCHPEGLALACRSRPGSSRAKSVSSV